MAAERVRAQAMAGVAGLVEGLSAWWMGGQKNKPFHALEHKGGEAGREFARELVQWLAEGSGTGYRGDTARGRAGGGTGLQGLTLVNRLTGARVSVHKAQTPVASWGAPAKARVPSNADRMAYAKHRALGYPIGSGVAESACRHLVGVRMKRTASMEWTEENAAALLQLRGLSASECWDEFWGLDKLWRTPQARAA